MNGTNKATILKGREAMDLYIQGKDAWNEWAKVNNGSTVDFTGEKFENAIAISFEGFLFPGPTSFTAVTFNSPSISFKYAIFKGDFSNFDGAIFGNSTTRVDFSNAFFMVDETSFNQSIFNGSVSFEGSEFYGKNISFDDAEFMGKRTNFNDIQFKVNSISFRLTKFSSRTTCFISCHFISEEVDFSHSIFDGDFLLLDSKFIKSIHIAFYGLSVEKSLVLDGAVFTVVPDFRSLYTKHPPSMTDMKVKYKTMFPCDTWAENAEHSDMYRKLKSMAIDAKDHARELEFFAMEERAKEFWHVGTLQYIPTYLYYRISDFGRSLIRPFIGLVSTWIASATIFQNILSNTQEYPQTESLLLSAIHLFPFFPWSRGSREDLIKAISGASENESTFNAWVEVTAYGESFLALIFVFLIGLALRNRFRL